MTGTEDEACLDSCLDDARAALILLKVARMLVSPPFAIYSNCSLFSPIFYSYHSHVYIGSCHASIKSTSMCTTIVVHNRTNRVILLDLSCTIEYWQEQSIIDVSGQSGDTKFQPLPAASSSF